MDVNECSEGTDNCSANASCTNTPGGHTCSCNAGYSGTGEVCDDVNECAEGSDNCSSNASCSNTVGGFSCACDAGYSGNGVTCSDVNECQQGTDNCSANASCTNTPGAFSCMCNPGYAGSGVTCSDINECTNGTHDCSGGYSCSNTAGSFSCNDINECSAGTAGAAAERPVSIRSVPIPVRTSMNVWAGRTIAAGRCRIAATPTEVLSALLVWKTIIAPRAGSVTQGRGPAECALTMVSVRPTRSANTVWLPTLGSLGPLVLASNVSPARTVRGANPFVT